MTVSPYLGDDSLQPFIETAVERAAGVFVLVKTSNPGGGMFQDLIADGRPLYRHVAEYVERKAAENARAAAAMESSERWSGQLIRSNFPNCAQSCRTHGFWCPALAVKAGRPPTWRELSTPTAWEPSSTTRGESSSHMRAKPYKERFGAARWQEAVEAATREMIEQLRANTPAGKLAE